MNQEVLDFIDSHGTNGVMHISEKPWGDYTAADYTIEQWHNACLIHQHEGPPTSKDQCKLPVKTPNGAVNRNAVHSALAALHGARAPLNASADEKAKAERKLHHLYTQIGEKFPEASHSIKITNFLEHFGKKGMKWGVRSKRAPVKVSSDFKKTASLRNRKPHELSNKQLQNINARVKLEQTYKRSNVSKFLKGKALVGELLGLAGTAATIYNLQHNPAVKAFVSSGRNHAAKFIASKASKVPFEQLKLF